MAYDASIRLVLESVTLKAIDQIAKRNFTSRSAVVRAAIARHVTDDRAVAENRARAAREVG